MFEAAGLEFAPRGTKCPVVLDETIRQAKRDVAFKDRAPWWGGDLQTLRNVVMRWPQALPGRASSLEFDLADGSGDRLLGTLSEPEALDAQSPLVVLIHGLTGCEESDYMRESARFHLARGRPVLRLNLRGAGPGRRRAKNYYFAGCFPDIQSVLEGLAPSRTANGVFLIGYSLGGNVLLNWLGRAQGHPSVIGAATVSAPIEPAQACERILRPRNALYHHFLIERMKRDVLASCAVSPAERQTIERTRTIFEFDDRWVAPRNGFDGALDYYRRTSGAQFVGAIALPTLMLHARNDPWIPADAYVEAKRYGHLHLEIVLTHSGGHLGFHERGQTETWHDRRIDAFVQTVTARGMPAIPRDSGEGA